MTDETKLTPMQKVDELIERGKSKGELTYKEVIDTLGNDALDVDQMEVCLLYTSPSPRDRG